jgi:hypothetical protein
MRAPRSMIGLDPPERASWHAPGRLRASEVDKAVPNVRANQRHPQVVPHVSPLLALREQALDVWVHHAAERAVRRVPSVRRRSALPTASRSQRVVRLQGHAPENRAFAGL